MNWMRKVYCEDTGELMHTVDAELREFHLGNQRYWHTKDGRRLLPHEFSDAHLLNTLAYWRRHHRKIWGNPPVMTWYGLKVPSLAADPLYQSLLLEASRRGLL